MEGVLVSLEEADVGVHRRARVLGEGLGHEGGPHALGDGDLLDDVAEGHDVVGHRQGVGVAQVDLLLPGPALVVAELHRDAHRFERLDRAPAEVRGRVVAGLVEVAAGVGRRRGPPVVGQVAQQVELDLGVHVAGEPRVLGAREVAPQHVARIGPGRRPVGHGDVAEHPRRVVAAVGGLPRQHLEGRRVRARDHVRLEHPAEALDRRPVEADALGEGPLELGRRDRHRLEVAEDVGEPQPHEADVAFFERPQDELLLAIHGPTLSRSCYSAVTGAS